MINHQRVKGHTAVMHVRGRDKELVGAVGAKKLCCERKESSVVWRCLRVCNRERYEGFNKLLMLVTIFCVSLLSISSIRGRF